MRAPTFETDGDVVDVDGRPSDPPSSLGVDIAIPLVVDLDHTLVLADTLHEGFAKLLLSAPLEAVASLASILRGRAAFKARVVAQCMPDVAGLPYRLALLDLLRLEKARGRPIHLVTAAPQKIADAVGSHLGLFDSAIGSDHQKNLKGPNKLAYLRERFADGFIYAGDHAADIPIFAAARGAILCDISRRVAASLVSGTTVLAELRQPPRGFKVLLRAFRAHQWSKNVLIFVPLVVGHAYDNPAAILAAVGGFLLVCLLASATYMLNDIIDLEADRRHRFKRHRPFASGDLPVAFGLLVAPLLIAAALAGGYLLAPAFAVTLAVYLCLSLVYSFGLKKLPLFDVFAIGILFVLRIVMGAQVVGLAQSPWLLSFSWAFFLSLALAKRHAEVARAAHLDVDDIAGRGYRRNDWPLTLTFGVGSGLVSVVIMLLYLSNDAAPSGFYADPKWLYAMPAVITMGLMRLWVLSNRMELHDDPVVFALRDPVSLLLALFGAIAFALAV